MGDAHDEGRGPRSEPVADRADSNLSPRGSPLPYWRLSGFYFFYFATLGVLVPYWALYLKHLGYGSVQIGQLMAVLMATKIISPNVWGWIADHTGRPMAVVRLGSLLALVTFLGVFLVQGFWSLAAVMLLFSFFWNAALPQFEATTLSHLGRDTHRYSIIRLWGSIGFIATVAGLGAAMEIWEPDILPPVLLLLFAGIWLSTLSVPERGATHGDSGEGSILKVLRRPEVIALLVVCFLMQASHGPYYTFFTIYMEDYGYGRGLIGQLWALGVAAEVGIFLLMHRLAPRFGLRALLIAALMLTTLRWMLIGFIPQNLPTMLFAQTLHAASFAIFHAVAIALFHQFFTGRHQGRGQALYSSLSFGAGGAIGALYSGWVWEGISPEATYYIAAVLSLAATLIAWAWVRER
ncbi:MFS transporter [Thiohalomonas denitrificans]|uniref:MFS transporter, PPP family, 3-phenylpropionic acid transporter n=1 Tax=Thiohalomonas denitrificans TaxID=415747 RepID=A0A1G5Q452_9GAMM|nr:MFS transporter [Thiohalomonas denitrificans]SCZ56398.1 MFS transporter, PPP family, 3-phenylpropionic acid transporter [Thiohalomonas denitrificans]